MRGYRENGWECEPATASIISKKEKRNDSIFADSVFQIAWFSNKIAIVQKHIFYFFLFFALHDVANSRVFRKMKMIGAYAVVTLAFQLKSA